ncbi:hypothetical protein ACFOQM_10870 [Paenibacillus sp. GCM10012307]|uniref:DUF3244 domain-containing protein n=1 Tax=Paenibacillus roseus TaxID=2798579 RepID=A0A934J591_9BACL|nr:hypothetical protein [Paenibacillus roseus]MBJ6361788.1 hypothetical protein [Paenibacillus roseus]
MKIKKLMALMLSAVMLITFATAANANPISNTNVITGQGNLKITGTAYFAQGSPVGLIIAYVYRLENGSEVFIESNRSDVFTNPTVHNYTINFNTVFPPGTYIIRISYAGSLNYLTNYPSFS